MLMKCGVECWPSHHSRLTSYPVTFKPGQGTVSLTLMRAHHGCVVELETKVHTKVRKGHKGQAVFLGCVLNVKAVVVALSQEKAFSVIVDLRVSLRFQLY